MTDSTPGLTLWGRIVTELADMQDSAPPQSRGFVVNPICGTPYLVDTCCAAAVFAAEYQRTDDRRWRARADDALRAARSGAVFRGISEPEWDSVNGWRDRPDSLPPTAIAVDAYLDAAARLELATDEDELWELLEFLRRCRTTKGGFAHNVCITGDELEVQNAAASVLYLLAQVPHGSRGEGHPLSAQVDSIAARLRRGQAASGFWRYYYPGRKVALREAVRRAALTVLRRSSTEPDAVWGGAVMHHLMTLYFAAKYSSFSSGDRRRVMVASAWGWIRNRLVPSPDRGLAIDWSVELTPHSPEPSNGRDTNAYFLILGALPHLVSMGVVGKHESSEVGEALLAHVASNLTSEPGRTPCVTPHEGPPEIVANFLPMFEQSAAWKGALLAETVMDLA